MYDYTFSFLIIKKIPILSTTTTNDDQHKISMFVIDVIRCYYLNKPKSSETRPYCGGKKERSH